MSHAKAKGTGFFISQVGKGNREKRLGGFGPTRIGGGRKNGGRRNTWEGEIKKVFFS